MYASPLPVLPALPALPALSTPLITRHLSCTLPVAQVRFRCDPLINFKLKQRLVLLGACVTLGECYATVCL
jgi:hypothetical protein